MPNILNFLEKNASIHPQKEIFSFLNKTLEIDESITNAQLIAATLKIAANLKPFYKQPCLLLLPKSPSFIYAFLGCLCSNVIAIPLPAPRRGKLSQRLISVILNSKATLCITTKKIREEIKNRTTDLSLLEHLTILDIESLQVSSTHSSLKVDTKIEKDAIAFLQYTSGSTGNPKGVMVTHQNIFHNSKIIQTAFANNKATISMCWLPIYHDMGLIEGIIQPIYNGHLCYQMQSMDFVQKPLRWLQAISKYKATVSGGPNFAFDLLINKVRDADLDTFNLKHLKVLFNGAEPIRSETLRTFTKKFSLAGFSEKQFFPCYGMAEATLAITTTSLDAKPIYSTFQLSNKEKAAVLVSSGKPTLGMQLKIIDNNSKKEVKAGKIGEIYVKGNSVCKGYWQRSENNTFNNKLDGESGYLKTGDLGILKNQQLYIVGRIKDLIIINGVKYYPEDIENCLKNVHEAILPNGIVAFSIDDGHQENIVVTLEIKRRYIRLNPIHEAIVNAIKLKFFQSYGFTLYKILLVFPLSLPRTTSGKISRHSAKILYKTSALKIVSPLNTSKLDYIK